MHDKSETLIIDARTKPWYCTCLYYLLSILTLGAVPLAMRMFPLFRIRLLTRRSTLRCCTHVLVRRKGHFEFVPVQVYDLRRYRRLRNTIHKELREFIHNDRIRVLQANFMRFVYDYSQNRFVVPTRPYVSSLSNHIMYGENVASTGSKTILHIVIQHVTSSIAIYVYICAAIWVHINYATYAMVLLAMTFLSIIVDIRVDIRNKRNMDRLANVRKSIEVFRDNQFKETDVRHIFPADIVALRPGEVEADILILSGNAVVDESFLTGESIPVYKKRGSMLRAGTVILECQSDREPFCLERMHSMVRISSAFTDEDEYDPPRDVLDRHMDKHMDSRTDRDGALHRNVIGRVVSTGFNTTKGMLIRDIITSSDHRLEFLSQSKRLVLITLCTCAVISMLFFAYFAFNGIHLKQCLCYALDLLVTAVSPVLPAAVWIGMNLSVKRLQRMKIMCNNVHRINSISDIDTVIFDKTGTLTEDGLDVHIIDLLDGHGNSIGHNMNSIGNNNIDNGIDNNNIDIGNTIGIDIGNGIGNMNSIDNGNGNNNGIGNGNNIDNGISSTIGSDRQYDSQSMAISRLASSSMHTPPDSTTSAHVAALSDTGYTDAFLMLVGMSTCHSVIVMKNECLGDPLDIKMFKYSRAEMSDGHIYINEDALDSINECNGRNNDENVEYDHNSEYGRTDEYDKYEYDDKYDQHNHNGKYDQDDQNDKYNNNDHSDNTDSNDNNDNTDNNDNNDSNGKKIGMYHSVSRSGHRCSVLNVNEFDPKRRRMSAVVRMKDRTYMFVKGSAESIKELLVDVPEMYDRRSKKHSLDGHRVIAMAYREIEKEGAYGAEYENGLTFLGFIVFTNKLKGATKRVIGSLKQAGITCLMATGDNILTSISVARECGMIEEGVPIIFPVSEEKDEMEWFVIGEGRYYFDKLRRRLFNGSNEVDYVVAIEGREFEELIDDEQVLEKTVVFARMNPDQKKMLSMREPCIFVGDGANDVGALQGSAVGLALNKNAATMNSTFVSNILDISSVDILIREGRCALVTSFCTFKYIMFTSLVQYTSLVLMVLFFAFSCDLHTMHYDILIVIPIAYVMGMFRSARRISLDMPRCVFLSHRFLFSFLAHLLIDILFMCVCTVYRPDGTGSGQDGFERQTVLATMMFYVVCAQAITKGIVFTEGGPHRESKLRKKVFLLLITLSYAVLAVFFVLMQTGSRFNTLFEFRVLSVHQSILLCTLVPANVMVTVLFEYVLKERVLQLFGSEEMSLSEYD